MNSSKPLLLIVILSLAAGAFTEQLNVSVYYESLCPDSARFIIEELYPFYDEIKDNLNLVLNPYGKASRVKGTDGKWVFRCQHGPSECFANTIAACVLNTYNLPASMNFINCVESMNFPDIVDPFKTLRKKRSLELERTIGEECANNSKMDWNTIAACIDGNTGPELLAAYGEATDAFESPISFVPTITINGEKCNNCIYALKEQICNAFKEKPAVCS